MPHPLDKATADGHNVDGGLKAIGLTDQGETPSFGANPLDFLSTKLSSVWMLAPVPSADAVKDAIKKGYAIFGTIDTWLIWNMTGGVNGGLHVTDVTNASRTMLMNLKTLSCDEDTLKTLGIPAEILPRFNTEVIGEICKGWPIPSIKIAGCLGDQHIAMLGQACKKGEAKSTYDTGPFILLNTGEVPIKSGHGLLTTLSYKLGPQAQTNYALEGSIVIAGAAVQWLRDSLGIIKSASEIEDLAAMVETTGGVYFVPAFNGLFAPWWREDARGVCIGITRFTNKSHIARAVLESMCFQVKDVLDSLNNEKGEFLLRVDGGATANNLLMHIQVMTYPLLLTYES
ncbi:LOW QUALITY PROTEIN: hypothetical protein HID58_092914 [Brassica napus]|uniref:Glycerol kinase n=1 Tax=Brassica napus TaxID=3708 RepID=A0ABQ7X6S3_BRANA|nr:LOW QUALITY PROTEIN: hypothetical protein HID58_094559 [Brassica napus]KAH0853750.1 LOW QUALITY PROTEIN: hypothetical protein HID58_092914 [Brassica napus]